MLRAQELRSALLELIRHRRDKRSAPRGGDVSAPALAKDSAAASDEEREPFHLDDTEIADRLRTGSDTLYRTPPHAHLVFPMLRVR